MLQLKYYPYDLAFKYPFTTYKGTKTEQSVLVVTLGLGRIMGVGEVGAISYYDVTTQGMIEQLEAKRAVIERYAMTNPERFWHFLHHLLPGQNFLIAALDIAGWDLFGKMRRKPVYELLGLEWKDVPITDYTIGMDSKEEMLAKLKNNPWPLYKVKMGKPDDIELVQAISEHTNAAIRVDANEGWSFDDAQKILPELEKLKVQMVEQPLHRDEHDAQKELKALSSIPLFADESCQTLKDIATCAEGFHGVNVKLAKCGGITPAVQMLDEAKKRGLKTMIGAMCESTVGSAAIANLLPKLDEVDADGPLLLKEDIATGLSYNNGKMQLSGEPGIGIQFKGVKFEK